MELCDASRDLLAWLIVIPFRFFRAFLRARVRDCTAADMVNARSQLFEAQLFVKVKQS